MIDIILKGKFGKIFESLLLGSVIIGGDLAVQLVEHNTSSRGKEKRDNGSQERSGDVTHESSSSSSSSSSSPFSSFEIDYQRLKGVSVTAFGFLVPIALAWYPFLHRVMARHFSKLPEGSFRYVMTKTALENILLPTPVCLGYFVIPAAVEGGHQWDSLPGRIKHDLAPSVAMDTLFWSLVSPINYKFVALKFQPLFSCVVDGVESAGLSFLTHQDEFKWPFS